MEINLSKSLKEILLGFFFIILPWIVILIGIIVDISRVIEGPWASWYYILSITWFGCGIVFFNALN